MRFWHPFLILLSMHLGTLRGAESATTHRFEPDILRFEALDRKTPPPPEPILFVGSSSVRLWTNLPPSHLGRRVLNRGFGGSTLKDLLRYFDRVVLPYGPSILVVYEGDNDLAEGQTPEDITRDMGLLLDRSERQLPGTEVILLTVKPSPLRLHLLEAQRDLNRRLEAMAGARRRVHVADVASPLLDSQGEPDPRFFATDRLHLNAAGYRTSFKPVLDAIGDRLRH